MKNGNIDHYPGSFMVEMLANKAVSSIWILDLTDKEFIDLHSRCGLALTSFVILHYLFLP